MSLSGLETFGQLLSLMYLYCKLGSTKTVRLCRCTRRLLENRNVSVIPKRESFTCRCCLIRQKCSSLLLCIAVENLVLELSSRASLCHAEAFRPSKHVKTLLRRKPPQSSLSAASDFSSPLPLNHVSGRIALFGFAYFCLVAVQITTTTVVESRLFSVMRYQIWYEPLTRTLIYS